MTDRLMERDWRFIIDTLLNVNMTSTMEAYINEVFDLIEYLISADQYTFSPAEQLDNKDVRILDMYVRGMPAIYKEEFVDSRYNFDAYFYGWGFWKETTTFRDTDMLSEEYRENSTLYKEIYRPQGIHYALRAHLVYKTRVIGNISIFNSKEHGDFSERDLYVLSMLAPHLSFKMGTLLEEIAARQDAPRLEESFEGYGLTSREQEIVKYLLEGIPDADLADMLYISSSTLKKHIYNIYKKMDVNNRVQLFNLLREGGETRGQ